MRSIPFLVWVAVTSIIVSSCDQDNQNPGSKQLSPQARNFLTMKMGSMSPNSMASANGFSNAANESFNRLSTQTDLSFGRVKKDSTDGTEPGDTVYYPSPWVSCALVTTTVNSDNSVTTVYDYGDGCEEGNEYFKYFMHGKYTYTYLYENEKIGSVYKDHYAGSYSSDNYGGSYYWEGDTSTWETNGSSYYSGTSEYDTANQTYRGVYEYEGDDVYTYDDITYSYSGQGKGSYNENGSIMEINDYSYVTEDYSYETKVLSPLVTRYDCYNYSSKESADYLYCFMPVYVSGRESIKYEQDGVSGSFEIDYGNGECDSIVTIIENGNRIEIDLYELYTIQ